MTGTQVIDPVNVPQMLAVMASVGLCARAGMLEADTGLTGGGNAAAPGH